MKWEAGFVESLEKETADVGRVKRARPKGLMALVEVLKRAVIGEAMAQESEISSSSVMKTDRNSVLGRC